MVRHLDSLVLAWRIASLEAARLGRKQIEPVHLFLGLLKIVDLDLEKILANATPEQAEAVRREVQSLRDCFGEFVLDSTGLRRRLRRRLRPKEAVESAGAGHLRRSPASRQVFGGAEKLADQSGGIVHPIHLLAALLQNQDPTIEGALEEVGCFPTELRRYAVGQLSRLHRI